MPKEKKESAPVNNSKSTDKLKLAVVAAAGIFLLLIALIVTYRYSQNRGGNIILPGGVTYLGPTPTPVPVKPTPIPRFTAGLNDAWKIVQGKVYPYSFSYPETLKLVAFPNDGTDSIAIVYGDIAPQQNILSNIELIDKRDPKLAKQEKLEYVKNWYKFFSGLKGVSKVDEFTNANGLKGYRAVYINTANQTPNVDVFFEVPGKNNILIHFANGMLDPALFERIIDSLKWTRLK